MADRRRRSVHQGLRGAVAGAALLCALGVHGGEWTWSWSAAATFDVLANVHGGLDTGLEVPGSFDLLSDLEYMRGEHAPRHRARLYLLGNTGGNFSEKRVGDTHIVSSIEAPNTVKLFEAWYEFVSPSNATALLLGLHDLSGEFDVLERGQLQVNSSFGTQPTLSQAMPSIFPTTAPGMRLRVRLASHAELAIAAYDGTPGDPTDPYSTHIRLDRGDGVFTIAEASLADGDLRQAQKLALGAWFSSAEFEDVAGRARDSNAGAYLIGETFVPRIMDERLGVFMQLSVARSDRNVVSGYLGGGFHLYAPLPRRPDDEASISIARARLGGPYRRITAIGARAETTVELTYRAQVTRWLSLQPDLQFIVNPASDGRADDALVLGLRIVLALE